MTADFSRSFFLTTRMCWSMVVASFAIPTSVASSSRACAVSIRELAFSLEAEMRSSRSIKSGLLAGVGELSSTSKSFSMETRLLMTSSWLSITRFVLTSFAGSLSSSAVLSFSCTSLSLMVARAERMKIITPRLYPGAAATSSVSARSGCSSSASMMALLILFFNFSACLTS